MTSVELGNARLLELADYLDIADEEHIAHGEPRYYQRKFKHPCGTPACALGHAQKLFGENLNHELDWFAIEVNGWLELFSQSGCGSAQTAKQAADYIRGFVAARS